MFYFGFLSSYLPYLLLIAAPLCYYFYGTVTMKDMDVDEVNEILSEISEADLYKHNSIHFNDITKSAANNQFGKKSQVICIKRSTFKCGPPPPLRNIHSISKLWSRPPPQLIV